MNKMETQALPTGKLDSELLKEIVFDRITYRRPEVITRPGIGEDCAVVDFGEYDCVLSTDPITAAISDIGKLAIHISCNDIASNGIQPIGILLAVMLPEGTTEEEIRHMMDQAGAASEAIGVEIIGGHTEITPAVKQPVIVSTALGRAPGSQRKEADKREDAGQGMEPGDWVLMTGSAGLEGTGIIACDLEEDLRTELTMDEIRQARAMLERVSVVTEGVIAGRIGTKGMHDITEGGVLGAVWEMCQVGGVGARIRRADIPVAPVTEKICARYEINPLRLISSGCMLIIASPKKGEKILKEVGAAGIEIARIGKITPAEEGILMDDGDGPVDIAPPAGDQVYKAVGR